MSEVSANTPKRQAIVERLKQRIDSFRKHHDDCQTRLERAQPSRELKQRQENHLLHSKFMENKAKTNAKLRHEQVNKITKQEGIGVGQEKSTSNTGLQPSMKRRNEFSPTHIDGEIYANNDELGQAVAQKYPRFDGRNGVHCNPNPNYSAAGDGESLALHNSLSFPTVNGHNGEFPTKSEEQTIPVSSFNATTCEAVDRTTTRPSSQQYPSEFAAAAAPTTTFVSTAQTNTTDNSILTTDINPVNFKKETAMVSPNNSETSTTIPNNNANGFSDECTTKSEENFESLLTDYGNSYDKDDDLKSQISEFERVFQGIKNQDRNSSECEIKSEIPASNIGVNKLAVQSTVPLSSELPDSVVHDAVVAKGNQLALSNGPNATNQLATASAQQQHATISRSTVQAVHQFIRAQQEERLTRGRFDKNYLLTNQNVSREQSSVRMPQRASHIPAIRQRVYEQIQQRRTNQQKTKLHGLAPGAQMQARNPAMNPMAANMPYQMHGNVRYGNMAQNPTQQTFVPKGRLQQNIMPQMHPNAAMPQAAQMQNMPRHQINMYVEQQKMAFQQQMASRLPTYSQAQHTSIMDMQQKITGAASHYPLHQQVSRTPQPLSHLQHYPNTYSNQPTVPTTSRQIQNNFTPEYNTYPYGYGNNQDKIPVPYQRHSSMDESLNSNRFIGQDMSNRNNFNFQRSSSLPAHNTGGNNVFNQTSPPVVRLGQPKASLPDMNNNANEHTNPAVHPGPNHPQLTHMKHEQPPSNPFSVSQEHSQANNFLSQSRPPTSLQQTFSNSFTNLLDLKSNSESSLFPFLGQDVNAGCNESTDFDSLLKSPPADFNLLNILESEPQKAL